MAKGYWRQVIKLFTGISLFFLAFSASGAFTYGLAVMGGSTTPIAPGSEFYVDFYFDTGGGPVAFGKYEIEVFYDKNLVEVTRVQNQISHSEFYRAVLSDNLLYGKFYLTDSNMYYPGIDCNIMMGRGNLARIWMKVKKDAKLQVTTNLTFGKVTGNYCPGGGMDIRDKLGDSLTIYKYEETTFNLQQYLDVNADSSWVFDENDVDYLKDLILKNKHNVEGPTQVKLGGIQMDFRGHARADYYDLAIGEAVARPTRFVSAGPNGICNTTKAGDDVQEIAVNNGVGYAIAILPGPNNVLDTTPAGDDTRYGQTITTGANGVCDTTAAGDDVQQFPVNQGQAYALCISPGVNGYLDTTISGDDTNLQIVFIN